MTKGSGRRVRLLQVTSELTIGGLERVVETLTRTIDPERFEVAVACLREKGPFAEALEARGFEVHLVREAGSPPSRLAFLSLVRLMRAWRPDVVHTHNTEAFLDGTIAARCSGVRTFVHTDHARAFPDKLRYVMAERVAAELAYRVVGVSRESTGNLRRYIRIPERKLVTIENGVDGAPFRQSIGRAEARASFGIEGDGPVLGLTARLEDQKGIDFLLDAFARVLAAVPDCHLLLAGTGSREAALRAQAQALGLDGRARFLGDVHDVPRFLRSLDVFLLPSRWEGLPMALLEAMASECAVLASSVGGIPGTITHGQNGWLVPSGDVDALARGIIELLSDADLRAALGRAALETFETRYSARAMAEKYEHLYLRQPVNGSRRD